MSDFFKNCIHVSRDNFCARSIDKLEKVHSRLNDDTCELVDFRKHRECEYKTLPPLDESLAAHIFDHMSKEYDRMPSLKVGDAVVHAANSNEKPMR